MSRSEDWSYHEARALDELRCAEEAKDPAVARLHRDLASLHRLKMIELSGPAERERQSAGGL